MLEVVTGGRPSVLAVGGIPLPGLVRMAEAVLVGIADSDDHYARRQQIVAFSSLAGLRRQASERPRNWPTNCRSSARAGTPCGSRARRELTRPGCDPLRPGASWGRTMRDHDDDGTKPPTPTIRRKLADFMKSNFGDSVSFGTFPGMAPGSSQAQPDGERVVETKPPGADIFEFNYRPRDIKAHLDRFVIRQDEAKKVLSIAVCDHYNHARFLRSSSGDPDRAREIEFAKQNVIIVGPTGVGKTYLVKHIADLIGVPVRQGGRHEVQRDRLRRRRCRRSRPRPGAQGATATSSWRSTGSSTSTRSTRSPRSGDMIGRDVSGRGVQTTLLKLMEETEVTAANPMDIQSARCRP